MAGQALTHSSMAASCELCEKLSIYSILCKKWVFEINMTLLIAKARLKKTLLLLRKVDRILEWSALAA